MARSNRSIPEINAGSMADIAFLLLIFFLVTTTIDTDKGLGIVLPPPGDMEIEIRKENILKVEQLKLMPMGNIQLPVAVVQLDLRNSERMAKRLLNGYCNHQ